MTETLPQPEKRFQAPKRSREAMVAKILIEASTPEATAFRISGVCHLSWQSWKDIMPQLIKGGLVIQKGQFFLCTQKGLDWLRARQKMNDIFEVA